jgi:Family of unknown function (DUF6286)
VSSPVSSARPSAGPAPAMSAGPVPPYPPPRLPRGRRTVSAVIVATVLLVLGALVAWQAILVQTGREPYGVDASAVADRLHQTPWKDTGVIIVVGVAIVLGLGLLALAVLPSRRRYLQLRETDPVLVTGITPANLRRALSGAAQRVNGINAAETQLNRNTATTVITSSLSMTERLPGAAQDAITVRLRQLDPVEPIAVRVRLSSKARR